MSDEVRRIHFIEAQDTPPSILCWIFGHAYITGTAFENRDDLEGIEMEVCRRCMDVRDGSWDGVVSFRTDDGRNARSVDRGRDRSGGDTQQ